MSRVGAKSRVGVVRRLFHITEWVLLASVPVLAGIRSVNPATYEDPLKAIIIFLANRPLSFLFWISIAGIFFKFINQEVIGKYVQNRQEIKKILDSLHEIYFQSVPKEELFKHRTTLFKAYRSLLTRRRNHLKIFERSGTAYLGSKTCFRIDDNREDINEGIAGRAWFINAKCTVNDLPEWPEMGSTGPQQNPTCFEYAKRGFVSIERAGQLTVKSRSFIATVVRNREGDRWGVLILDSRDPDGITDAPDRTALVTLGAALLTRML
jgi:hypothetical protein